MTTPPSGTTTRLHGLLDTLRDVAWWVRHPSTRRCSRCKLTWEPRDMLAANGGVCHDCAWREDVAVATAVWADFRGGRK